MKNIVKYRACSVLLTAAITLIGCSGKTQKYENSQEKEIYHSEELLDVTETKVDYEVSKENLKVSPEVDEYLQDSDIMELSYDASLYDLYDITIIGINEKDYQFDKVSDEFYKKLNRIIREKNVVKLSFENLDNTFDFAKINSSTIEELSFKNCKGVIDLKENNLLNLKEISLNNCQKLDSIDITKKCDRLEFTNMPLKVVKKYILEHDISETRIWWSEYNDGKRNLKSFLELLLDYNINIDLLDIYEGGSDDYNGITNEEFNLLSKLNVKCLDITDEGSKDLLNLDLNLNKNINSFYLRRYYKEKNNIIHSELGNIKIRTNNKDFHCDFIYTDITKNTHFSLPNCTWISLSDLECKDISVFNELSNVEYLFFKEDLGKDLMADTEGGITYCRDSSIKFFDEITNEEVETFREYNEFLNYLKMCNNLVKVKEKLNIQEDESKYQDVLVIGDIVNLNDENTPIYASSSFNIPTTAYYKTSELRCIYSIVLEKDNYEIEVVDDMNYYEVLITLGFSVKGYNLVNQYSLNKDESLTTELYCDRDGVQLVKIPFKH